MTHLSAAGQQLLDAIFSLGLLTLAMSAWMSITRLPAMKKAGLSLQDAAHSADLRTRLPSSATRVADNYNHLMEAPTVFYAVSLAIVIGGLADGVYVTCAWAFVALRVAHSVVQATINVVALRATLYGLSWFALAVLIVRPFFSL